MTLVEKARELRKILEKAMTATQSLTEAEAITATCLHGNDVATGLYNEVMALPTEVRE